jgi:effector-binding domain-containing protein
LGNPNLLEMKIAKYILLLLALFSIAFSVFVATQPGSFEIVKEKNIDTSKTLVFDFISNLENATQWFPYILSDDNLDFTKNENNSISSANWKSTTSQYQLTNETLFNADSLYQNFQENDNIQKLIWKLEEQKEKTKIVLKVTGNLSFKQKLNALFHGGAENVFGPKLEVALTNIENRLNASFVEHSITIQGFSYQKGTNFIKQKDSCSIKDFDIRSKEILKKVNQFVEQNGIQPTGNPFVLFDRWEERKNFVVYAFCIPIEEEIVSTTNPNITGGNIPNYLALKTKLIGNTALHRKKAYDAAIKYIAKNKYEEDYGGYYLEIYPTEKDKKQHNPTVEIIIPVRKKIVIQTVQDSLTTSGNKTENAE